MHINLLATLPVKQLKEAVAIREKILSLEHELSTIVGQSFPRTSPKQFGFSAASRAQSVTAKRKRRAKLQGARPVTARSKKPSARGQLKERIIGELMAAGKPGITIKDISQKLGTSYGNINVWFHTTAKGVKEVKKVAPGRFAWAS